MHHCYFNGIITPVHETTMQINDLGFLRGYGMFDYFQTYNGRPFQWDMYWTRYERSAKSLNIPNPIGKDEAYGVVMELLEKSGLSNCAMRFVLTGGYAEDSISVTKPNLLIISEDTHPSPRSEYEEGISVMSHEFVRDIPDVKSTDYKHLIILRDKIKAAGATDVLFHKDGEVSELSRSNLFIFKGDSLITSDKNVLNGITRQTLIDLAKPHFNVEERTVTLDEVLNADEIFTSSTTKRVLPVTKIDEHVIGDGKMGDKSRFLLNLIDDMIANW
jgi:branched-subunit amino acid aminotransferase/4-amino-4-deoxychorismate lyase